MRIYRSGWRTFPEIAEELRFVTFLNSHNLSVSIPVADRKGNFIKEISLSEGQRFAVLFSYAEGERLQYNDVQDGYAFGRSVAMIHERAIQFPHRSARQPLHESALIKQPTTGFINAEVYESIDRRELLSVSHDLMNKLRHITALLEETYCHGDLHGGNAHMYKDTLTHFDFDCSGLGWVSYDIAVFLWYLEKFKSPDTGEAVWQAFLDGYSSIRLLKKIDADAVRLFCAIRQLWFLEIKLKVADTFGQNLFERRLVEQEVTTLYSLHHKI